MDLTPNVYTRAQDLISQADPDHPADTRIARCASCAYPNGHHEDGCTDIARPTPAGDDREALAAAWNEGFSTAVEAAPGDLWVSAWDDIVNPYGAAARPSAPTVTTERLRAAIRGRARLG